MGEPMHHDWQQIVLDLLDAGFKQSQLATKCNCSPSMINQIKSGQIKGDLRSGIATPLLNLHRYHCKMKG